MLLKKKVFCEFAIFCTIKQILIDYEGNGANYHRRGDLGATIFPSRKAREDDSPEITEARVKEVNICFISHIDNKVYLK